MKYKKIWVDKVIYIEPKGKGAAATAIRLSSFKEKKLNLSVSKQAIQPMSTKLTLKILYMEESLKTRILSSVCEKLVQ